MEQASPCRAEPAGIEIKGREPLCVVEVDFHPFAASIGGMTSSHLDQLRSDTLALEVGAHFWVEQEGVIAAVPRHVREAKKRPVRITGGDPTQTVGTNLVPPAWGGVAPVGTSEFNDIFVFEIVSPRKPDELDIHGSILTSPPDCPRPGALGY